MERDWARRIKEEEAKIAEVKKRDEEREREWKRQIA